MAHGVQCMTHSTVMYPRIARRVLSSTQKTFRSWSHNKQGTTYKKMLRRTDLQAYTYELHIIVAKYSPIFSILSMTHSAENFSL